MDLDEFWFLIERSAREAGRERDERERWLVAALRRRERHEIEDFAIHFGRARERTDTYRLWDAAGLVYGGACSGDIFWYFQAWVIGQGRAVFERVVTDPDNLAELPAIRALAGRNRWDWSDDEWPDWESLAHVAAEAYGGRDALDDALAGRGHEFGYAPGPTDEADRGRHYPRLAALSETQAS